MVNANESTMAAINISTGSFRTMEVAAQTKNQPIATNQDFIQRISIFSRYLKLRGIKASVTIVAIVCVVGLPDCAETAVNCYCASLSFFVSE